MARLYVTKGLPYLLETIALVKRSHPATEFRVYGDGPLRDELLAHAARLGLDGPAIFPGPFTSREDLTRIMAPTDVFLLSFAGRLEQTESLEPDVMAVTKVDQSDQP